MRETINKASIEAIFRYFPSVQSFVGFDLETTGAQQVDRIVEISMVKVTCDRNKANVCDVQTMTLVLNPQMPIAPQASLVHGFSDEDVKDCPTFAEKSEQIYEFIKDADLLVGYNIIQFDFPLLLEHFYKVDINHPFTKKEWTYADAYKIFSEYEKRDLTYALKFYCGQELENAHSAEADVIASINVLGAQVDKYEHDGLEEKILSGTEALIRRHFTKSQNGEDWIYAFGKHKGQKVGPNDQYLDWILKSPEFSNLVKNFINTVIRKAV